MKPTIRLNLTDEEIIGSILSVPLGWVREMCTDDLREKGFMQIRYIDESKRGPDGLYLEGSKRVYLSTLRKACDRLAEANLTHCRGYSITAALLGDHNASDTCVDDYILQTAVFGSVVFG